MGRCAAFGSDGKASFSLIQAASDSGDADASSFFSSTFLYVDGEVISSAPVTQRRERLRSRRLVCYREGNHNSVRRIRSGQNNASGLHSWPGQSRRRANCRGQSHSV